MSKICCCTGHRPKSFPYPYGKDGQKHKEYLKQLKQKILLAVKEYGVTRFISGMAIGADMDFAEHYPIALECAIPCSSQTLKWDEKDKLRYESIIKRADEINIISERYTAGCMFKRNRYMVDKSEIVIAVFNGVEKGGTWYTINYAKKENKVILLIDLAEGINEK